jgi:hypothetical protein
MKMGSDANATSLKWQRVNRQFHVGVGPTRMSLCSGLTSHRIPSMFPLGTMKVQLSKIDS